MRGMGFFPTDRNIFASDGPFDPEKGPGYLRAALKILASRDLPKADREKIFYKNVEAITGRKFAK